MWYMIVGEDHEDSLENRLAARDAHLARLNALADDGRLIVAGLCRPMIPRIRELRGLPAVSWS